MDPDYMGPEELTKFMPGYAKEFLDDVKNIELYTSK
jgi:hypothetical protein